MSTTIAQRYTHAEERANVLTHALGIGLSLIGTGVLLMSASATRDALAFIACAIYAATLILMYVASTLYHGTHDADAKHRMRTLDHIAIFLLIAGTYTPFELIALRGAWGWSLFALTLSLAVAGILVELTPLKHHRALLVALYVGIGWIGLVAIKPLIAAVPVAGLWLVIGGGAVYTLGIVFYKMHGLRYHHAIWHLFVLAGSALQYFAVLAYVLPLAYRAR